MNKDIRLAVTFPDHPKTVRLINRLGLEGVWSLIRLWLFAAQQRPDGRLVNMDVEDIAIAAKWPHDAKEFVETLLDPKIRFLEQGNDGYLIIHDWHEHNTYAAHAQERSEKARKAAVAKWEKRLKGATSKGKQCTEHDLALREGQSGNAPSPSPSQEKEYSSEILGLTNLLADKVLINNPNHRYLSNGKKEETVLRWSDAIDKLHRIDKQTIEDIRAMIEWCQGDPFWKLNILSAKKLRDQWDQLYPKMKAKKKMRLADGNYQTALTENDPIDRLSKEMGLAL